MKRIVSPGQVHSSHDIARAMSLFSTVRRIMRTKLARDEKFDPSTWLRIETMKFILEQEKPKMKDIANYLSITAPSATSLIGELVKDGFVTSCIDRRDRRALRLMLTKKGKIELEKAIVHGVRILSELFSTLSETEFLSFINVLEQIKNSCLGSKAGN